MSRSYGRLILRFPVRMTSRGTPLAGWLAGVLLLLLLPLSLRAEGPAIADHEGWVTSVAFHNTHLLAGGGQSLLYRPGFVRLFDVETGNQVAQFEGPTANVWSVALSPDGKTLAAACYDGKVLVWNAESKELRSTLSNHKGWVRCVTFAPDGGVFASAGEDGQAIVWKTESLEPAKTIKAHESAVYQVAFSADGSKLATASLDKTAKLWNWNEGEAGQELAKLEGHEDAVWSVTFAGDGRLATAGADRKIKTWDAEGKPLATLEGHKDWVSRVAFSPDHTLLAAADLGRTVKIWKLETAEVVGELGGFQGSVWSVAFSPDGKYLAAGTHKDGVRLWTTTDWQERFPAAPKEGSGEAPASEQ